MFSNEFDFAFESLQLLFSQTSILQPNLSDHSYSSNEKDHPIVYVYQFVRRVENDVMLKSTLSNLHPVRTYQRDASFLELLATLKRFDLENKRMTFAEMVSYLISKCEKPPFHIWKDCLVRKADQIFQDFSIPMEIESQNSESVCSDSESYSDFKAYKKKLMENLPDDLRPHEKVKCEQSEAKRAFAAVLKENQMAIERLEERINQVRLERPSFQFRFGQLKLEGKLKTDFVPFLTPNEAKIAFENGIKDEKKKKENDAIIAEIKRSLSKAEVKRIKAAMNAGPDDKVVASANKDSITRSSLKKLRGMSWLNDEIINMYMQLLSLRDERLCEANKERKPSHFFNSFFLTVLLKDGYSGVRRWTRRAKVDVFALSKIFVPVNLQNTHWCMLVVDVQRKVIQYYDSMGGSGRSCLDTMESYMAQEHKDKRGVPIPPSLKWKKVCTTDETPRQKNGSDCGVFSIMFAEFLSLDLPLEFDQSNMALFRQRIALQLLEQSAIGIVQS